MNARPSIRNLTASPADSNASRSEAESAARFLSWVAGINLGLIVGGSALLNGVLAVLVVVPGLVWAAREPLRPLGLAGLLIGMGAGVGGLFIVADARCATFTSSGGRYFQSCASPDPTPYLVTALVLVALGGLLTALAEVRRRGRAAR